jgi:hypothetical protein
MNARRQITMDPEMQRRAEAKAAELGISFVEYVRWLVAVDIGEPKSKAKPDAKPDISMIFDLIDEGPPTDIARNKDQMIGDAVWANYLRKVGRKPSRKRK